MHLDEKLDQTLSKLDAMRPEYQTMRTAISNGSRLTVLHIWVAAFGLATVLVIAIDCLILQSKF